MIVADAGPLIGLARVGLLDLLPALFGTVVVPSEVFDELAIDAERPGSRVLREAARAGWLVSVVVEGISEQQHLESGLGAGERAAILLAEQQHSVALLIDEKRGRAAARKRSLPVLGTGGVLLAAKRRGHLASVRSALDGLAQAGYRLSPGLRARLLELAGEAEEEGSGKVG